MMKTVFYNGIKHFDIGGEDTTGWWMCGDPPLYKLKLYDFYEEFSKMQLGLQIEIINYYFRCFHEELGEEQIIDKVISENINKIIDFHVKWFDDSFRLFQGDIDHPVLDLTLHGTSDYIVDEKRVYDDTFDYLIKVTFENGDVIESTNNEEIAFSIYIEETKYEYLRNDFDKIVELFNPVEMSMLDTK